MDVGFRIADTFTESLAKLTGEEQRAAKTTAFDLQLNPAQPGMQFHRVERARDKNFWSVRVNRGVRMIVHKTAANLLLCYVGEHDDAYRWRGTPAPRTAPAHRCRTTRRDPRGGARDRDPALRRQGARHVRRCAGQPVVELRRTRSMAGRREAGG